MADPPKAPPRPRKRAAPAEKADPRVDKVPPPPPPKAPAPAPIAAPPSKPDFLLASMIPPQLASLMDEDSEQTRVGMTVVGAPAYQPKAQSHTKKAFITVIAGNRAGEMFKLHDEDETVIGRGPQSTIHLDSDGVSRKHARIVPQAGDFVLEDLQSTNGTWIEQRKIQFHKLVDGDRVQVGTEVIVRFNLHDELEAGLQQQLYESAVRDPLTRAYNRKHFQERLRAEIGHAIRHRTPLSLILLDIDFFKKVNDTHGHPAGDAVLRALANAIQKVIRVEDVFARIGGEEFALLARGIDGPNAVQFAERLRRGIERLQIPWASGTIPTTSSFGVATVTELAPPPDADALVARADKRLYEAKSGGRNRVVGPT